MIAFGFYKLIYNSPMTLRFECFVQPILWYYFYLWIQHDDNKIDYATQNVQKLAILFRILRISTFVDEIESLKNFKRALIAL